MAMSCVRREGLTPEELEVVDREEVPLLRNMPSFPTYSQLVKSKEEFLQGKTEKQYLDQLGLMMTVERELIANQKSLLNQPSNSPGGNLGNGQQSGGFVSVPPNPPGVQYVRPDANGPLTPTELKELMEEMNKVRFPTQPLLCFPPTFNVNPTVDPGQSVSSSRQYVYPQIASQLGAQNLGVADNQYSRLNLNQQTAKPTFSMMNLNPTVGSGQSVNPQFASQVSLQNVGLSGLLGVAGKQFMNLNLNQQTVDLLNPQVLNGRKSGQTIGLQSGQLQAAGLQSEQAIQGVGLQLNLPSTNASQNLQNFPHTAQQKSPFSQDLQDLPNYLQNFSLEPHTNTDFQVSSQTGQQKSPFSAVIQRPSSGQIGNQGGTPANVQDTGLISGVSEANLGFGLQPELPSSSLDQGLQNIEKYLQNL